MASPAPTVDLLDAGFYVDGAREAYAWMREHAPVYRDEAHGLWALATYAGVRAAEGNPAVFSNAGGSRAETGPLPWMMDMDAPDHVKRRKLVNHAFTPARVRAALPRIDEICDQIVDAVCEQGACDFRHDIAAPLPLIVICDMLGVPAADRAHLLAWSDAMLGSLNGGPETLDAAAASFGAYMDYARDLITERRERRADDLISVLVHAEVDGDRLEDDELVFEILLLLLGGDETTRNVTTGGMEQLLVHPEQWHRLLLDRQILSSAVEEMLRWVSPIKNMNRTVTRDIDFDGVHLREGDKVLLLFESANFDEAQFPDPGRFDIERSPNEHIAFGFGPHVCLGATLARFELHALFDRLLDRVPDVELATDVPPPRSITGISEMPVRFAPSARLA